MKLLRKDETPIDGLLNNWLNDEFVGMPINNNFQRTLPEVNLIEGKEDYAIEISAPGFDKKDFNIELDNFNLSISVEKEDIMNEDTQFIKREFNYTSFKRSFKLAKHSNTDKIYASYENGILKLNIPKTKDAIPLPVKSIKIG